MSKHPAKQEKCAPPASPLEPPWHDEVTACETLPCTADDYLFKGERAEHTSAHGSATPRWTAVPP